MVCEAECAGEVVRPLVPQRNSDILAGTVHTSQVGIKLTSSIAAFVGVGGVNFFWDRAKITGLVVVSACFVSIYSFTPD